MTSSLSLCRLLSEQLGIDTIRLVMGFHGLDSFGSKMLPTGTFAFLTASGEGQLQHLHLVADPLARAAGLWDGCFITSTCLMTLSKVSIAGFIFGKSPLGVTPVFSQTLC